MRIQSFFSVYSLFAVGALAQPTSRDGGKRATDLNSNNIRANNATGGAAPAAVTAGNSSTGGLVLPDGRIKQDAKPEDFNVLASVFKSAVVKGDGSWLF